MDPLAILAAGRLKSHLDAASSHSGHEVISDKGQADGYASLDDTGNVPVSQLCNIKYSLKDIAILKGAEVFPFNWISNGTDWVVI